MVPCLALPVLVLVVAARILTLPYHWQASNVVSNGLKCAELLHVSKIMQFVRLVFLPPLNIASMRLEIKEGTTARYIDCTAVDNFESRRE